LLTATALYKLSGWQVGIDAAKMIGSMDRELQM
jgi:hypothetical protein